MRDLLAWAGFINATAPMLGALAAYAHGAYLVLLDGIGLGIGMPLEVSQPARTVVCECLQDAWVRSRQYELRPASNQQLS